jgi:hypothetical protein
MTWRERRHFAWLIWQLLLVVAGIGAGIASLVYLVRGDHDGWLTWTVIFLMLHAGGGK